MKGKSRVIAKLDVTDLFVVVLGEGNSPSYSQINAVVM